jgi:16S rRNA (guanine966-N2)-methyltransferase
MKIISGKYKGRNILGFNIDGTRPTQDRVKENLFNMINFDIRDKVVLDLFAGSGNLGLEALSREAKYAYFVDKYPKAISIIEKNSKNIVDNDNYKILNTNYKKAIKYFKENNIYFDIVFLDPPYDTSYIEESLFLLTSLINKKGLIICESNDLNKIVFSNEYKSVKQKKYGDKYIVILEKV